MTKHRTITPLVIVLALGLLAVPEASGNPLLSGYGSPGQGSQTILGSVVLGGHGGSGGGSGSSGGGSAGGGGSASAVGPASGGGASSSAPSKAGASGARVGAHRTSRASAKGTRSSSAGTPAASASASGVYGAAERGTASSQVLGLTGEDLALVVLVLAALLGTGLVTRLLARSPVFAGLADSSHVPSTPSK
jgi:hypothetical protein